MIAFIVTQDPVPPARGVRLMIVHAENADDAKVRYAQNIGGIGNIHGVEYHEPKAAILYLGALYIV